MMVAVTMLLALLQQPIPFTVEMAVSPETEEGQREVARRAVELCAGRYPQLGRYTFKGMAQGSGPGAVETRFTYRGEVNCVDRPPAPSQGTPVGADWRPSEADEQRSRAATMAYFAAVDRGDVAALEAMMSPEHRATSTPGERAEKLRAFRQRGGAAGEHRIVRTTWYVNPQGVAPGAYVAVDFDRRYANLSASCGYVAWHRQQDGRLLLVREEIGDAPRAAGDTPERLAETRRLLRCRD